MLVDILWSFRMTSYDAAPPGFCILMRPEYHFWMSPQHFLYVTGDHQLRIRIKNHIMLQQTIWTILMRVFL